MLDTKRDLIIFQKKGEEEDLNFLLVPNHQILIAARDLTYH